jgi:hypothetical protein
MPSYDQLDNEEAWRDELAAPALLVLASQLRAFYPGAGIWIRGDNNHLRGYHRSRRWIQTSIYCTNRTYSVSRTWGDRNGGNYDWVCALDLALPHAELTAACRRLDAQCRAGRLEKVTEWFGNLGGDSTVDGWDNISNRPASADTSHLTHLHISFDRGRANDNHDDLLAILTGVDMGEYERATGWRLGEYLQGHDPVIVPVTDAGGAAESTLPNMPLRQMNRVEAKIDKLTVGGVDVPALVQQLTPALVTALRPMVEEAVREVLGSLNDA